MLKYNPREYGEDSGTLDDLDEPRPLELLKQARKPKGLLEGPNVLSRDGNFASLQFKPSKYLIIDSPISIK
jgi:hypothetical protein